MIAQTLCRTKDGKARRAALEVLLVTPAVASNIREGKTHQIPLAMQTGRKLGMIDLNQALLDLVTQGVVAPEEAYAKAVEKGTIVREFERLRLPFTPPAGEGEAAARAPSPAPPPGAAGRAAPPGPRPAAPARPAASPGAAAAAAPAAAPKKGWFS